MRDPDPTERRDRHEQDVDADVSELTDAPAAGVVDPDLEDPPEPSEPG
jgi:hypothetical protein